MDLEVLIAAVVGGALTIAGGYLAVTTQARVQGRRDEAERLRAVHRAVLSDTRDNMLALLTYALGRAAEDRALEKDAGWASAALLKRVDPGYLGDEALLVTFYAVVDRLVGLDPNRISGAKIVFPEPFGAKDLDVYDDLRSQLIDRFLAIERLIERGEPFTILPRHQVDAARRSRGR